MSRPSKRIVAAGDGCQAEDGAAERGLARPGLADQADGLAADGCPAETPVSTRNGLARKPAPGYSTTSWSTSSRRSFIGWLLASAAGRGARVGARRAAGGRVRAARGLLSSRIASNSDWVYSWRRVGEDRARGAGLHDPAVAHHRDPVAQVGDDAEVVGDDQHAHVELRLQVTEQVEHLGLDRDVEGGGRLVGDEQVGVAGDRAGDQHALGHAARDLVRVGREGALRVGDAHAGEQVERPLLGLGLAETQARPASARSAGCRW